MKKQFITRVFLSSLVLALTSLFGGGNLLAQTVVFYESFDKCASTGGNDDKWTGSIASGTISDSNTDKSGWKFVKGYVASKCAKFGSKSDLGSATTPALGFEGDATLTFKAGAWKDDATTLRISISGGGSLSASEVTMTNEAWTEYTINITKATTSTQIKFEGYQASKARFFLDEVKITQASSNDPDDTRKNPELAYGESKYNATIGQTDGFPTLSYADGVTDNDIVYSSSEESVATVDEAGNVYLKGEGETTIKASISGSKDWKDAEASYILKVSKPSANLAYTASSCYVVIGEDYTLPKLTYTKGVTGIVFASSDESVATVDDEGVVALTGAVGTTTITASLTDDATYADGSASYTLTVKKPNVFVYKKVTSAEDLVDGGVYIMVCDKLNSTISAIESEKGTPTDVTISGDIVEAITGNVVEFTLEDKGSYYRFKNDELYLYGKSSTIIGLKALLGTDDGQKWNITIDAEVTKISCLKDGITNRQIGVNTTINPNKFGLYSDYNTSKFPGINLYRKVYPLTVSSATSGYATFYNDEEAYQMPAGLTGYAVTKAENGKYITRKTAYEAGATVPAKTPLLIIGEANSYYPAVVSGTGVDSYTGNNLLEGTRDANGFTQSAKKDVYYYKLGLNANVPGFYWGAENGAAFKMTKATTAYLAVSKTLVQGANALFFDFGGETGINEIQTEQADKAVFDLSGRRVKKATKGFYIVGGKKVLVK